MQQLVMNLVTNASEAIGEEASGLITIRTGLQAVDEAYDARTAARAAAWPRGAT